VRGASTFARIQADRRIRVTKTLYGALKRNAAARKKRDLHAIIDIIGHFGAAWTPFIRNPAE
jgi:hypothetical protein